MDEEKEEGALQNDAEGWDKAGLNIKDAAQKGKKSVKITKFLLKVIVPILLKVVLPIIIASVLIACFWKIIKGDAKASTISSFSKAIGENGYTDEENSIGASIKIEVSPDGKFYTIQYDVTDEEIANVKKILREKEITDLTEENIKFITTLVKHGYKLEDYANKEQLEALLLFFKAQKASQSLDLRSYNEMYDSNGNYIQPEFNIEGGIQGVIRVQKIKTDSNNNVIETPLTYALPDNFNNQDNSNRFTINEKGEIVVSNNTEVTVEYIYPQNYTGEIKQNETTVIPKTNSAQYKPIIAKSSMPFNLLATLMIYTEDVEFCKNIANSVATSNIVLALKEEETQTITTTNTKYMPRTEKYYDFAYTLEYTSTNTIKNVIHDGVMYSEELALELLKKYGYPYQFIRPKYTWKKDNSTYNETFDRQKIILKLEETKTANELNTENGEESPLKPDLNKNYTELTQGQEYNIIEKTTSKYSKQELEVKEIVNWFMEYSIGDYTVNTEGPTTTTEEPITNVEEEYLGTTEYKTFTENTVIDSNYQDTIINNYKKQIENKIKNNGTDIANLNWKILGNIYTKTEEIEKEKSISTVTTIKNILNGTSSTNIRNKDSENSFLYFFDKTQKVQGAFESARGMIFEALEEQEDTIDQVNILKYLLYLYTGDAAYEVDAINWDELVGKLEFSGFGGKLALQDYLYQFSHGTAYSAPMYNNGAEIEGMKFYKVYGDANSGNGGRATVGDGDLCIYWCQTYFNNEGYILEGNIPKSVNVKTYLLGKLGAEYNFHGEEIYIEKNFIDNIAKQIADDAWNKVESKVTAEFEGNNPFSMQQMYALVSIQYGRNSGNVGKIISAYKSGLAMYEANSPEHNRYIWDTCWYSLDKGKIGWAKGNDARFETYVKGTIDFSSTGGVFNRKSLKYYTRDQLKEIGLGSTSMTVERTVSGVNDDNYDKENLDRFVYEESKNIGIVAEVIKFARDAIGAKYSKTYRTGPDSYDCSGLILMAYDSVGITVPQTTKDYFENRNGNWDRYKIIGDRDTPLKWEEIKDIIQPGDVLVCNNPSNNKGHAVLYAGGNNEEDMTMIHASDPGGVIEVNLHNYITKNGTPKFTAIYRFWD